MLTILNNYAHGLVVIPIIDCCRRHGLFGELDKQSFTSLDEIRFSKVNRGYLKVALSVLESISWLESNEAGEYRLAPHAEHLNEVPVRVAEIVDAPFSLLTHVDIEADRVTWFRRWLGEIFDETIQRHSPIQVYLEGCLLVPTLLEMKDTYRDSKSLVSLMSHFPRAIQQEFMRCLHKLGWVLKNGKAYSDSDLGNFIFERIFSLASVYSYRPMIRSLDNLIFGDCTKIFKRGSEGVEQHVDRRMNVRASGFQHQKYFRDLLSTIDQIFNNPDILSQPKYIADMGCGDGSLLKGIIDFIREHTNRGKALEDHPLGLIGIDYNEAALAETRITMQGENLITLQGDIGDPKAVMERLKSLGVDNPDSILHVRSFLDHDRPFIRAKNRDSVKGWNDRDRDYFAVDREGGLIESRALYESLVEHLERWSKVIGHHGLLLLEVHSLPFHLIADAPERSESLHFDAYHRLSHQLLVDAESFVMAAAEASLFVSRCHGTQYPKAMAFTRILQSRLFVRPFKIRPATLKDMPALMGIEASHSEHLEVDNDIISRRIRANPLGQLVLEQEGQVLAVVYSQMISSEDEIHGIHGRNIDQLHCKKGRVVQLLGLKVLPDYQDRSYGHELLDFFLFRCSLLPGVSQVIGVSRCKGYRSSNGIEFSEYTAMRDETSKLVDPVLRFHESHGAEIGPPISAYRPNDLENQGYGVMIRYHLRDLKETAYMEQTISSDRRPRKSDVKSYIERTIKTLLAQDRDSFSWDRPLLEMGLDSADMLELQDQLGKEYELSFDVAFFFRKNTAAKINDYLIDKLNATGDTAEQVSPTRHRLPNADDQVAIIGLSCKLPGSVESIDDLWDALITNKVLTQKTGDRWQHCANEETRDFSDQIGLAVSGLMEDMDCFDNEHFRVSPKEAKFMDPQQRLLLEKTWHCIEDAGLTVDDLKGSNTGVFIGASGSDYRVLIDKSGAEVDFHVQAGSAMCSMANRISYFYDLNGPCLQIDTACSSSLVAIHQAVQALRQGQCDQAIVGGVNVICQQDQSIAYSKAGMLSPSGLCRPFSDQADGYVRSEGVVVFMLKPLQSALEIGDDIYAIINGSAVNHGGQASGFTVPNPDSHTALYRAAWNDAKLAPGALAFIEAHGTGTELGDPIEVEGLKAAFESFDLPLGQNCVVGSVKSNVGHLEAAAGVMGLLKAALSLHFGELPASLGIANQNPHINLGDSPLSLATENRMLASDSRKTLYGAVSSFGSGGTNAHVVLSSVVREEKRKDGESTQNIFTLSAKSESRLKAYAEDILVWLQQNNECSLGHLCENLQRRTQQRCRLGFAFGSHQDLMDKLLTYIKGDPVPTGSSFPKDRSTMENLKNWLKGETVGWHSRPYYRLSLPSYPFKKKSLWFDITKETLRYDSESRSTPASLKKPSNIRLKTLLDDEPEKRPLGLQTSPSVTKEKDILIDLKNAMPIQAEGMIPTLNRTGYMIEKLTSFSEEFALFAGLCGRKSLDLGCAYGIASIAALEQGAEILAVDMESQHLSILERRIKDEYRPRLSVQPGLLPDIDFQEAYFGAIHAARVFHFLSPDSVRLALSKIFSWLVPGGKLFLIVDTPYVGLWRSKSERYLKRKAEGHQWPGYVSDVQKEIGGEEARGAPNQVNPMDMEIVERECRLAGFEIERVSYEGSDIFPDAKGQEFEGREHVGVVARKPGTIAEDRSKYLQRNEVDLPEKTVIEQEINSKPEFNLMEMADLMQRLKQSLAQELQCEAKDICESKPFTDMGVDSIIGVTWVTQLNTLFGLSIKATQIYSYPTLKDLAEKIGASQQRPYIAKQNPLPPPVHERTSFLVANPSHKPQPQPMVSSSPKVERNTSCDIAIIGSHGRFPNAANLDEFWHNIESGKESISEIPKERWWREELFSPIVGKEGKTCSRWMGILENVSLFDPYFFNISPAEAEVMDPQQRIFLQSCWHCIESAGYPASKLSGEKCGVFVGCAPNDYTPPDYLNTHGLMGGASSILAARISYFLNLRGPCLAIDTACSSSLVALSEACDSLSLGNSDFALAGGVNVIPSASLYIKASHAGVLSPDGRCFTFDQRANGFVAGEGVGVVLLKRLNDAIADGDSIQAVIRAWGVNQDGKTNGITAPSSKSQVRLQRDIYDKFSINPAMIDLVEAHGTGTKLGDPIEVEALQTSFSHYTNEKNYCALGSVKTNIGHTLTAAGIAGILKLVLALKHKTIPPTINYESLNEHIDLDQSPFYIPTQSRPWKSRSEGRWGAVSSFGFSGTNAHVVLSDFEARTNETMDQSCDRPVSIVLSAKTPEALQDRVVQLGEFADDLVEDDPRYLKRLGYTLQICRDALNYRWAAVVEDLAGLKAAVRRYLDDQIERSHSSHIFTNLDSDSNAKLGDFIDSEDLTSLIQNWFKKNNLIPLTKLWVNGELDSWAPLYGQSKLQFLAFPPYPFAEQHFWLSQSQPKYRSETVDSCPSVESSVEAAKTLPLELKWVSTSLPITGHHSADKDQRTLVIGAGPEEIKGISGQAQVKDAFFSGYSIDIDILNKFFSYQGPLGILYLVADKEVSRSSSEELEPSLELFRWIKAIMSRCQNLEHSITWTLISEQGFSVSESEVCRARLGCLHGLMASASAECGWETMLLDVERFSEIPWAYVFAARRDASGDIYAYRKSEWFIQRLVESPRHELSNSEVFREGGVYLLIGGHGGLGRIFANYLLEEFQATVYLMGRRPVDQPYLESGYPNRRLTYLQGDATRRGDLESIKKTVLAKSGAIHGVMNCAVAQFDSKVSDADEVQFKDILATKILSAWHVSQIFGQDSLDFIVSFSSMASFARAAGMAAYSTGCLYQDLLSYSSSDRCKVVNWGYWAEGTGLRISKAAQNRVIQQGYEALTLTESLPLLQSLIAGVQTQRAIVKVSQADCLPRFLQHESALVRLIHHSSGFSEKFIQELDSISPYLTAELEDLTASLVFATLREMGTKSVTIPQYQEWIRNSELVFGGAHRISHNSTRFLWQRWRETTQKLVNPDNRAVLRLMEQCMNALPDILLGRKAATEIIFPGASLDLVERVYKHNRPADFYNRILSEVIAEYLSIDGGNGVRILEVGAGTGGSTEAILKSLVDLDRRIDEYVYTDVSQVFLNHGEDHFKNHLKGFRCQRLNIEEHPEEQGFNCGEVDILIASNSLHATRDLRTTLEHCRWLLKDGGLLALNEISRPTHFAQVTFGLLDGWWLADDRDARLPGSPGMSPESWVVLLESSGFSEVWQPIPDSHELGQQIIIAECEKGTVISPKTAHSKDEQLWEKTENYLRSLLHRSLRIAEDKIRLDEDLEHYGIDSILIAHLNRELEKDFGPLSSTIFFECRNLRDVTSYFTVNLKDKLADMFIDVEKGLHDVPNNKVPLPFKRDAKSSTSDHLYSESDNEPIAIIGLHGRYSEAESISEFWDLLRDGRSGISEVPKDRWDMEDFFQENVQTAIEQGFSYSKWGGFIKNVKEFDPLFFNISPNEALGMDPQERFFLQSAWSAMEDAGYSKNSLQVCCRGKVGVFAGVTRTGFDLYGPKLWERGMTLQPHTSFSSVANRVSYALNLNGPSLAIDTMCSSSLTAVHEACSHILAGECDMAIAGGVNLFLHPSSYVGLCANKMLSQGPHCQSFGEGADGFVPGEGVGTVVLKRLSQAESDGDHIYGVILASRVNHGGRTHGYTVPNPKLQAKLIKDALDKAKVDPRSVSYVEAHGTGTELGDPIEIEGLTRSFRQFTEDAEYCALGSVKSNIGHLEAAAGVAGLTKILLQFKHQTLVPSLHADQSSRKIRFHETPFYLQKQLSPWETSGAWPRRAALSSFGAGGANAHLLLEEYAAPEVQSLDNKRHEESELILLSAKTEDAIRDQIKQVHDFLNSDNLQKPTLKELAYTLQVGRESMTWRVAIIARSISDLVSSLKRAFDHSQTSIDEGQICEVDCVKHGPDGYRDLNDWYVDSLRLVQERDWSKIASYWLDGVEFEWLKIHKQSESKTVRVSLPSYPFAREVHWWQVEEVESAKPERVLGEVDHDSLLDQVIRGELSAEEAVSQIN